MVGIVFGEFYCTFSVVFYLFLLSFLFFSFLLFSFTLIAILLSFCFFFLGGIKGLAPPALYIIHDCHVFASGVLKISMGHRVS